MSNKVFACQECRRAFEGSPFSWISDKGIGITKNGDRPLCGECAAKIAVDLAASICRDKPITAGAIR